MQLKHKQRRVRSGGVATSEKLRARLAPLVRLVAQQRHREIVQAATELLRIFPAHAYVLKALSFGLIGEEDHESAIPVLEQALRLAPADPELHNNLGICLSAVLRWDEAIACFDRALALDGADAEVWKNKGAALCHINRWDDAIPSLVRAIELFDGDYDDAIDRLAAALLNAGRNDEAYNCYAELSRGAPTNPGYLASMLVAGLRTCNWDGLSASVELVRGLSSDFERPSLAPFHALAVPGISQVELLQVAETQVRCDVPASVFNQPPLIAPADRCRRKPGRLRLAYLSYDFSANHPVAAVIPQVLESHDRTRVETFGYAMGRDDGSDVRQRLVRAFEHFVDIRDLGVEATARKIADDGIDILVDLQGWTKGGRPAALARRPAPILVNWLGYAGTMGNQRLADYLIGDAIVTPPEQACCYTEKIARLPHCYLPMDATQTIAEAPGRAEAGLPETGLVLCSFNNSYKFNPQVFDLWGLLLNAVPGSCLWLSRPGGSGADNLLREAVARGVAAERIIFAGRVEQRPEYLARLQLADLALDPFPFNSHSSGMDVLWAGVPMVTLLGDTFASRVGASLLAAVGLPECIARSSAEYLQLCMDLCRQSGRLQELRQRLAANRGTAPLFDMKQFTRDLEDLYFRMQDGDFALAEAAVAKG